MSHSQNFPKNKNLNVNYVKNINNMMNRMQSSVKNNLIFKVSSFEGNSDKVFLISQASNQSVYPNQQQTLLGTPIIPMIGIDKQMTFTEKNLQIVIFFLIK